MAYAYPGAAALDYYPCRYGKSKLLFRGPRRDLDRPYVAVLGGTETYGKFVPDPYPALVERATGIRMVNLGAVNAGVDVYLNEPAVLEITAHARATVLQIVGARNLSNRFYTVHPRRNDRFLRASASLQALYREVDFTEFHFTRHMLQTLHTVSPSRFKLVAQELRTAWVARMTALLERIPGKSVLLWIADHPPALAGSPADPWEEPVLIDAAMIAELRARVTDYLEVVSRPEAETDGSGAFSPGAMPEPAARGVPGPAMHRAVAEQLTTALERLI